MDNTNEENDLIKRCSRCGNFSLKSSFHKNKKRWFTNNL